MSKLPELCTMPPVPQGSVFKLLKIDHVADPHPYCITSKHVEVASKFHSGYLDPNAIRDAEKRGAVCDICKQNAKLSNGSSRILSFDQHENLVTLYIAIPKTNNINDIPGLHEYLYSNKERFIQLGIQGFALPTKKDENNATDTIEDSEEIASGSTEEGCTDPSEGASDC